MRERERDSAPRTARVERSDGAEEDDAAAAERLIANVVEAIVF